MKAYSLFSGSSGNCFFVDGGNDKILIDCGVCARNVENALSSLGVSIRDISAIFVTHEHIDHTKGLEVISKRHHIPTYMTEKTARALITDPRASLLSDLYLFDGEFSVKIGAFTVSAFFTSHDSACPVGYTVEKDGIKLGFATDTGYVTENEKKALVGCCAVLVEANHDTVMLELGPYPFDLKRRIKSDIGHLSNADCAEFCRFLCENGTKSILLGHISKENNVASLAVDTVKKAIENFSGVIVAAASPNEITELII